MTDRFTESVVEEAALGWLHELGYSVLHRPEIASVRLNPGLPPEAIEDAFRRLTRADAPIVPAERFIDGYQSRNERLADLMRRMGVCEEKGSGIDRVVQAAETFQLPAPDFRTDGYRTMITIHGHRPFAEMDRADRVRACYQHCALRLVMDERMTNQTLRERFHLPEGKTAVVSQVIAATIEAGLIKSDERVGSSRKYARYLPFWG